MPFLVKLSGSDLKSAHQGIRDACVAATALAKEHPGKMVTVTDDEGIIFYDTLVGTEDTKYAAQPWASVGKDEDASSGST